MKRTVAIQGIILVMVALSASGADATKGPTGPNLAPEALDDIIAQLRAAKIRVQAGGALGGLSVHARSSPNARRALALLPSLLRDVTAFSIDVRDADDDDLKYVAALAAFRGSTWRAEGILRAPG